VLLSEEPDAVDHLLSSISRGGKTLGEAGILALEELNALGRDDTLHPGRLQSLEPGLGLQSTPAKRGQLVTQVLYEMLELVKRRGFRSYAV
jgi:hypothetical protein